MQTGKEFSRRRNWLLTGMCAILFIPMVADAQQTTFRAGGRDRTPPDRWSELLFWGKFVGSDRTHRIVRPGCGWSHYPPNAERDYDWANKRLVETDIEDWKPNGTGKKQRINCDRWGGDSLRWFVYWMQNLPGADNGLSCNGRPLTNWWIFLGDFDRAMQRKTNLVDGLGSE